MKECPRCGASTTLGRMYCPKCGFKLDFIEDEVTRRAAEERKAEKIAMLQDHLVQWIALTFLVLVVMWCFKDYALRRHGVDTPVFFYGPPVVGTTTEILKIGMGRLEIARETLAVPRATTLEPEAATTQELQGDLDAVKKAADAAPVTVARKDKESINGKLLGRTETHVSIARGDEVIVIPAEEIESIQRVTPDE